MSKGILEYDLANRDEEMAMRRALKSSDMAMFIWELQHNFWKEWKHDETDFNLETYRKALGDLLDVHSINVDELIN